MADFKALATSYVLEDDELRRKEIAAAAATAIQDAPRKSSAVLSWAQSINEWMPSRTASDGQIEEGQDFSLDGDVIVRAKALAFLAATLEALSQDVLKAEQVEHLIAFFGAMFAIDHKAGIMAAAKALRYLSAMRNFKPSMAATILGHVVQLKDDFRLQAPPTRLEIYELVERLVGDDSVRPSLEKTYGPPSGFMIDLLHMCRSERDPQNLVVWFGILTIFLGRYSISSETAEEVFNVFSDYFPISMRSSATPTGITVDDLKSSLRACFSASHVVATSVFDFLLQKLDQGDALTANVKVDILRTIQACVEGFPRPALTLVPHASRIWNSLKYEVRNGEVQESIDGTLKVIRSISTALSGSPEEKLDPVFLGDFVQLVLSDCIGDLSNPTYTRQTGLLLTSVLGGGARPFALAIERVLEAVKQGLRQSKSATNARDLITLLNDILRVRYELIGQDAGGPDVEYLDQFHGHDTAIRELFDSVYLRAWKENSVEQAASGEIPTLKEIMKGLAELIRQPGPSVGQETTLLCTPEQCDRIVRTLSPCVIYPFQSISAAAFDVFEELAPQATLALQSAAVAYPAGFSYLVEEAGSALRGMSTTSVETGRPALELSLWSNPSPQDLLILREMLSRLAFIGCSTIPTKAAPLGYFVKLVGELLQFLGILLDNKVPFRVSAVTLSGIHSAMLYFRDASFQDKSAQANDVKDPITAAWEEDFRKQYSLPAIDAHDTKNSSGAWLPSHDARQGVDGSEAFREYLRASLSVIAQLYRRATVNVSGSGGVPGQELSEDFALVNSNQAWQPAGINEATSATADDQDRYLHQLATMATFVIRDLDEVEQENVGLHQEALRLFHPGSVGQNIFRSVQNSRVDVLSMGILRGLRPAAVNSMVDLGIGLPKLLEDFAEIDSLPDRTKSVRECIATIISNKYLAKGTGLGSLSEAIKVKTSGGQASSLTPSQFSRLVAITAGGVARLDKDAKELAILLSLTPADCSSGGEQMARALGMIVSPKEHLSPENHAVIKTIYKQWVYARLVKTLIPSAFPVSQDAPRNTIYTISILSILRHTPFAVYEDDLDQLVRILIAAVVALPDWADIEVSLRILIEVVDAKAPVLADHLKALVDGAVKTLTTASSRKPKDAGADVASKPAARPSDRGSPKGCRKQALVLLSRLPTKYDERHLLPYCPSLTRILAAACGDRVREIREVAQVARENWSNVR